MQWLVSAMVRSMVAKWLVHWASDAGAHGFSPQFKNFLIWHMLHLVSLPGIMLIQCSILQFWGTLNGEPLCRLQGETSTEL